MNKNLVAPVPPMGWKSKFTKEETRTMITLWAKKDLKESITFKLAPYACKAFRV